ncbi:MAG TPA: tetratricopeptide repeat protein [Vicinamibacterales bacterium]|nr:tetratricopeptide repeat protein [Vicinamibacterales bacterium]
MWRIAVIVFAGALAYANAWHTPFIYDDTAAVVSNEHIRTLAIPDALFAARENPAAGRPLVNYSFALNYAAGGLSPVGYHLVNIAIHLACGVLLFAVARRAFASDDIAFAIALLWIVHPLASEAVDYVTERSESLMALCFLLTLFCAQRIGRPDPVDRRARGSTRSPRQPWWAVAAVVACALGMGAKETMVVAPLVVALYDRVFVFDSWSRAWSQRKALYAGLAATWVLLVVFQWSGPRVHSAGFGSGASPWTYLLNQAVMIVRYLRLALWPRQLVVNYGWPRALTLVDVLPQALLVVALIAATVALARRHPRIAFAGAWFFLFLAPTSSILPIATEVGAERRMYLPLVAIVALAVVGINAARRRLRVPAAATTALLVVSSVALTAATLDRNREYVSTARLATTTDERWPTPVSDALVGYELWQQGQRGDALARLRRSANGGYSTAWYTLGGMLLTQGQVDEGIAALQTFLQKAPLDIAAVQTRVLLGRAFLSKGDPSQAIAQAQQARSMDPSNVDVLGVLSDALLAAGQRERAIDAYRAYLAQRPDDLSATLNVGTALAESGRLGDAASAFERARDLAPNDPRACKNLASLALNGNDVANAIRFASEAVRVAPRDAQAHDLLGRSLAGNGDLRAAMAEFDRAIALNPAFTQAQQDLETVRRAMH